MNFNGGKKPMYIFGVDIDKLYEEIKLFKNLPEFCDNLVPKTEKTNRSKFSYQFDQINDEENNENNRNKKKPKKIQICKMIERLSQVKTKKKEVNKLRLSLFRNNNLSDILPSLSFSTKASNNSPNIVINKSKKKRPFRNIFYHFSQDKKILDSSYINNLNNSKKFSKEKNFYKFEQKRIHKEMESTKNF